MSGFVSLLELNVPLEYRGGPASSGTGSVDSGRGSIAEI